MLEITNGSKLLGTKNAIKNVSLKLEEGKVTGLLGENGAGKTTLLRSLCGIYKLSMGEVLLDGEIIYDNPETKKFIGFVSDDSEAFPYASVRKNIEFYKTVYENFDLEKFGFLNEIFKVDLKKKVNSLSKGNKMKLNLMLNFSIGAKFLLLDEPTNGLDPKSRKDFLDILGMEADRYKTGIIVSSHNVHDIEIISDELVFMHDGQIILKEETDALKSRYTKIHAIFKNEPADIPVMDGLVDYEKSGSSYYFIFDGKSEALNNFDLSYKENCPLTLEDIFFRLTGGSFVENR